MASALVIITKYIGPSNTKGARISAKWSIGGRALIMPYPYELNGSFAHKKAADKLLERDYEAKIEDFRVICGDMPNGYVFILEHRSI